VRVFLSVSLLPLVNSDAILSSIFHHSFPPLGAFQQRPKPLSSSFSKFLLSRSNKMGILKAIDVTDGHKLLQLCILMVRYQFFAAVSYISSTNRTKFRLHLSAPPNRPSSADARSSSSHTLSTPQSLVSTSILSQNFLVHVSGLSASYQMLITEQQVAKHTSSLDFIVNTAQLSELPRMS